MRTTIDLDERALLVARSKAAVEGISLGRAVSELILDGVERAEPPRGFPMFPSPDGHTITDELVASHRDD